jgi:hypothetical protein
MKFGQRERESLWKMVGTNSFSVGGVCRVYVCCVPDFDVVVFQDLLSSIYWDCVVSYGGVVTRNCLGQVVCHQISFQTYVSFDPVEGDQSRFP